MGVVKAIPTTPTNTFVPKVQSTTQGATMLNTTQLDQLAHLKSFIRAKAISKSPRANAPRIVPKVQSTTHTINPDSNIAKYPPKHLTAYNIDWNSIIACGMVVGGKEEKV
jgi:hypothetical protein